MASRRDESVPDASRRISGNGASVTGEGGREGEFRLNRANLAILTILQERDRVTNVEPIGLKQLARLQRELVQRPGNRDLLERYAFLLYSAQRVHQALEVYQRLVDEFEPRSDTLYYLGCCHLILFQTRAATRVWAKLKKLFPDSPLGAKADRVLDRLRELTGVPKRPSAGTSVRTILKRIEASLDLVAGRSARRDEATGSLPEDSGCSEERKALFFSLDEIGGVGALETIECLVAEEPDNVDFLDWAAYVQYCNGNLAKACDYYRRLLELTGANPFAFYYIGEILFRSGAEEKAFGYWSRLIEQYPGHQLAEKARRTMTLIRATEDGVS